MPAQFDVICLGTGPASSTVAIMCAKEGLKVAVIESREFGGTCALRGCNPKKVFTNAAALFEQFQRAKGRLVRGADVRIEWSDLVAFQHEFTNPVRELTEAKLQKRGIETFHGCARFESERVIRAGETLLEAKKIFLGTGAKPVPLKIPGEELIVTSDDFMELKTLPPEVLFLGGGFISFEFANIALRAGSSVTIVDRHELPLKPFDPDLVRWLLKCSETAGIRILTRTGASAIERQDGQLTVTLKTPEGVKHVSVDLAVHGGGRVPNLDGMQLEAGRVAYGKRGILIKPTFQSSTNPAVYASGDCADMGVPMLTPTAEESAHVAAKNILADHLSTSRDRTQAETHDQSHQVDFGPIPQVVFSVPPLAAVGLSEADARAQGFDIDVRFEDLSTKGEVRKLCASVAGCKVVVDRQTDRILGAHVLGPHAEETINLFTLAVRSQIKATSLKSMLFAYPTMTGEYLGIL